VYQFSRQVRRSILRFKKAAFRLAWPTDGVNSKANKICCELNNELVVWDIFFYVHPQKLGKMIQFDELIFLKGVGSTTN